MNEIYQSFDLLAQNLLPDKWDEQIRKLVEEHAKYVFLDGKSSTSREPDGSQGASYYVVLGGTIRHHLPWLYNIYSNELAQLASQVAKTQVTLSPDIDSAININTIKGEGSRYEWHVDTNPLTGLLYVTTHTEEDGGQLTFRLPNKDISIYPKSGVFLAFDARSIPHAVAPLKKGGIRISIPMNYYTQEAPFSSVRPTDLDDYIYKNKSDASD